MSCQRVWFKEVLSTCRFLVCELSFIFSYAIIFICDSPSIVGTYRMFLFHLCCLLQSWSCSSYVLVFVCGSFSFVASSPFDIWITSLTFTVHGFWTTDHYNKELSLLITIWVTIINIICFSILMRRVSWICLFAVSYSLLFLTIFPIMYT